MNTLTKAVKFKSILWVTKYVVVIEDVEVSVINSVIDKPQILDKLIQ